MAPSATETAPEQQLPIHSAKDRKPISHVGPYKELAADPYFDYQKELTGTDEHAAAKVHTIFYHSQYLVSNI